MEENEALNAEQAAIVYGMLQPTVERLSQELRLLSEPVLAKIQEEADAGDELTELHDADFKAEFGPPPEPPTDPVDHEKSGE